MQFKLRQTQGPDESQDHGGPTTATVVRKVAMTSGPGWALAACESAARERADACARNVV